MTLNLRRGRYNGTVKDATWSSAVSTPLSDIRLPLHLRSRVTSYVFAPNPFILLHKPVDKMTPASKVDVELVFDKDMPTCVEVMSKAFGHDAPFVDIYFPNHDTPAGQGQASKRLTTWKQGAESSTFLKAVTRAKDGGQEEIIGFAIWTLMTEAPPSELAKVENVEEVWPDKNDREFMTRLWSEYVIPRTQSIKDSDGKGIYGMWHPMVSE